MLRNLAAIMIRPRAVMQRVLGSPDRTWIALVILSTISATAGDFDRRGFANMVQAAEGSGLHPVLIGLIGVGIVVAIFAFGFLFFFLFSWAAWGIGKVMEGTGDAKSVRRAVAWGLVPTIWALLYRIPAIFLTSSVNPELRAGAEKVVLNPGRMGEGCLIGAIFGALEIATLVWVTAVMSNTVGEAHQFSGWRGLATLVLTSIAPLIIVLAAVLAM